MDQKRTVNNQPEAEAEAEADVDADTEAQHDGDRGGECWFISV